MSGGIFILQESEDEDEDGHGDGNGQNNRKRERERKRAEHFNLRVEITQVYLRWSIQMQWKQFP